MIAPGSRFVFIGLVCGCMAEDEGPLGVNEVASTPTPGNRGEPAQWLEILNDAAEIRSLDGWTLRQGADVYTLPTGAELSPGELRLVWFDGEVEDGALHTLFTLPVAPFVLVLADDTGEVVQDIHVPVARQGTSFGRVPDDAPNWQVIEVPSPGKRNTQ